MFRLVKLYKDVVIFVYLLKQFKIVKCWKNSISRNIKAVFLKLGTTIAHHKKKKKNDAPSTVAIATLSAPVVFWPKNESSICNLLSETKGPTGDRRSSHIVVTPIRARLFKTPIATNPRLNMLIRD